MNEKLSCLYFFLTFNKGGSKGSSARHPNSCLEFFAGRTATMRFSRTIQTAFKDLSIRDLGPRRFVTS